MRRTSLAVFFDAYILRPWLWKSVHTVVFRQLYAFFSSARCFSIKRGLIDGTAISSARRSKVHRSLSMNTESKLRILGLLTSQGPCMGAVEPATHVSGTQLLRSVIYDHS